jgi:hypothetical protein
MKYLTNILLLIAMLMLVAICASAQVTYVSIHAPCTQTASQVVGAYSGQQAIVAWQFGFISVNVITGAQSGIQFKNGVWKAMTGGCTGQSSLMFTGDCWQSVINLTASNGTAKWLVTPGAPTTCQPNENGLMVWKWNGSAYDVAGLIRPPAGRVIVRLGTAILNGDIAWTPITPAGNVPADTTRWIPCHLDTMVCDDAPTTIEPPGEGRQTSIGGFGYNFGIDYAHPPVDGGPQWYWMARSDQPTPTRPPAPSATRTATGGVSRTPTRTQTYSPCPPFCPPTNTPGIPPTRTLTTVRSATPTASPTAAASRFQVSVAWQKPDGTTGVGTGSCSASQPPDFSTGFYFFSPGNTELYVSVLPSACAINGNVWVKIMGATTVAVSVAITDRQTGFSKTYINPQGQMFLTVIDTAYEVCP